MSKTLQRKSEPCLPHHTRLSTSDKKKTTADEPHFLTAAEHGAQRETDRLTHRERAEREQRDIRETEHEIEVLQRKLEEQKLRAERDALHAEVAGGAGGGEERRNNREGFYIVSCCANIWAGSPIRHVANFSVSSELVSIKTPQV